MTMEAGAEAQQGADTAVAETEAQQITQAQIATLTQVTTSTWKPAHQSISSSLLGHVTVSGCETE